MSGRFSLFFCFFKQKTAYEMRISDWSSDVCSSDLVRYLGLRHHRRADPAVPGLHRTWPWQAGMAAGAVDPSVRRACRADPAQVRRMDWLGCVDPADGAAGVVDLATLSAGCAGSDAA